MRAVYDGNLDRLLEKYRTEGKDTSLITSIIQLYQIINSGQLDINNIDLRDVFQQEKWHEVGTTGEPAFASGWANYGGGSWGTVAFMKDSMGFVHLKGMAWKNPAGADEIVFTLPVGYRPIGGVECGMIFAANANQQFCRVDISPEGYVRKRMVSGDVWVSFWGITFKAEQ